MSSIDEDFSDKLATALIMERSHMSENLHTLNQQLTNKFNEALKSRSELSRLTSAAVRQDSYSIYLRGSFTAGPALLETCAAIKDLKAYFKEAGYPIKSVSMENPHDRELPPCAILKLTF